MTLHCPGASSVDGAMGQKNKTTVIQFNVCLLVLSLVSYLNLFMF